MRLQPKQPRPTKRREAPWSTVAGETKRAQEGAEHAPRSAARGVAVEAQMVVSLSLDDDFEDDGGARAKAVAAAGAARAAQRAVQRAARKPRVSPHASPRSPAFVAVQAAALPARPAGPWNTPLGSLSPPSSQYKVNKETGSVHKLGIGCSMSPHGTSSSTSEPEPAAEPASPYAWLNEYAYKGRARE
jgi:hypothetical protein